MCVYVNLYVCVCVLMNVCADVDGIVSASAMLENCRFRGTGGVFENRVFGMVFFGIGY